MFLDIFVNFSGNNAWMRIIDWLRCQGLVEVCTLRRAIEVNLLDRVTNSLLTYISYETGDVGPIGI